MEKNINSDLDLPPEASHYTHRIGGHIYGKGKLKLGTLKHKDGSILKPLIEDDIRSAQELSFYEEVFKNSEKDPILYELKKFLPSFHGTLESTINGTGIKYLCIEDVCGKFQNPSILNVKIGPIVWEPDASEEKIEKEKKKYPPVKIIGFRILGMKVYDHNKQIYISQDKHFGLGLDTPEKVNAGIGMFFNKHWGQINILIISGFLHRLLQLKSWFSKQRKLIFLSSSLLLVYEGNLLLWTTWLNDSLMHVANTETCKKSNGSSSEELIVLHNVDCSPIFLPKLLRYDDKEICGHCKLRKDVCIELQNSSNLYRISAIDLAHVLPTTEEDDNYMFGLNRFISHLQMLLNTYSEISFV